MHEQQQPAAPLPGPPPDLTTPAHRVRALAARIGQGETASWCAELLAGRVAHDDPDRPPLAWLGGAGTPYVEERLEVGEFEYWPRVWGARGLLHVWPVPAERVVTAAVVAALADPAWRVREMAAKVVARHEVGEAAEALMPCATDPVARVRAASVRALGAVGEHEHTDAVVGALRDQDGAVRRAAERSVELLERRLDLAIRPAR